MPVRIMPIILQCTFSAMDINSASTEGLWPLTFSPGVQET